MRIYIVLCTHVHLCTQEEAKNLFLLLALKRQKYLHFYKLAALLWYYCAKICDQITEIKMCKCLYTLPYKVTYYLDILINNTTHEYSNLFNVYVYLL